MPKAYSTGYCTICNEKSDEETFPFCSGCGAFIVDTEDLDLSPNSPIDVIFKRNSQD